MFRRSLAKLITFGILLFLFWILFSRIFLGTDTVVKEEGGGLKEAKVNEAVKGGRRDTYSKIWSCRSCDVRVT